MTLFRPRSLQLRLAVRLGILLLVATILAVAIFAYLGTRTADSLSRRDQFRLADELAEAVREDMSFEDNEQSQLRARGLLTDQTLFVIRRGERVIVASNPRIRREALERPPATRRPSYFRLEGFGDPPSDYYGMERRERSKAGPVSVMIAQPDDTEDELLHALLQEIGLQALWIIPTFIAATLLVGVYAIRSGLRPLRDTARQAAEIRPEAMSVRLETEDLPTEIAPVVDAVNRALDRLEEGFAQQRQFTANAAHELRTPLAIITAAIDGLQGDGKLAKLKQDVARMNRLVEQLLHVARLDNVDLDITTDIDLNTVARSVVEQMAPLAIEQDRSIALYDADESVPVRGNRYAIEDALRNLVENALTYTAPATEVTVQISNEGTISVCDRGPGVAAGDHRALFERFWRGRHNDTPGSGLGLSIVSEIMKRHGGRVEVSDNPGGGACFTLDFPPGNP